jgi:hypothetical protein
LERARQASRHAAVIVWRQLKISITP